MGIFFFFYLEHKQQGTWTQDSETRDETKSRYLLLKDDVQRSPTLETRADELVRLAQGGRGHVVSENLPGRSTDEQDGVLNVCNKSRPYSWSYCCIASTGSLGKDCRAPGEDTRAKDHKEKRKSMLDDLKAGEKNHEMKSSLVRIKAMIHLKRKGGGRAEQWRGNHFHMSVYMESVGESRHGRVIQHPG